MNGLAQALADARERVTWMRHSTFLRVAYHALLDREPDDDGLARFTHDLRARKTTREQVLRDLVRSEEAASHLLVGPGPQELLRRLAAARATVPAHVRPVLFLHIPKCGGSALTASLVALAGSWPVLKDLNVGRLLCAPSAILNQAMLVAGHLPAGASAIGPQLATTLTVLREPVARTLSHFAHVRQHEDRRSLDLATFVSSDAWRARWVNHQARHLLGVTPMFDDWTRGIGAMSVSPSDALPLSDARLRTEALAALRSIDIVGTSDDLGAVAREVASRWEKQPPAAVAAVNVSADAVDQRDVPASILAEITRSTRIDAELHAYAARQ